MISPTETPLRHNCINYNARRTSKSTARISIQSSYSLDSKQKPEIWRFFLNSSEYPEMHRGAIIGKEPGRTCVFVVSVWKNDLICTREKLSGAEDHRWNYYRVGDSFQLIPLGLPNRCHSKHEIGKLLTNIDTRDIYEMEVSDRDLEKFFSETHPNWLQDIASRQIFHWENNKPKKYFRFAPFKVASTNICRCVKLAPCTALARFKKILNPGQLAECLKRSPAEAVRYAFKQIPLKKRRSLLLHHAKEALLYSISHLSDEDLRYCASLDMGTAFQCRLHVDFERRASILAHSYLIIGYGNCGSSLKSVQEEIRKSLEDFPGEWRASDPDGFSSIFRGLLEFVGMEVSPGTMAVLLEKTEGEDRLEIARLIASNI